MQSLEACKKATAEHLPWLPQARQSEGWPPQGEQALGGSDDLQCDAGDVSVPLLEHKYHREHRPAAQPVERHVASIITIISTPSCICIVAFCRSKCTPHTGQSSSLSHTYTHTQHSHITSDTSDRHLILLQKLANVVGSVPLHMRRFLGGWGIFWGLF